MRKTITLTDEQYQALQQGESITIEPPKPAQWEPKGVPKYQQYFGVNSYGKIVNDTNTEHYVDIGYKKFGNMSTEEWQAKELYERNRKANLISQYVFENLKNGESRDRYIFQLRGQWRMTCVSNEKLYIGAVLMPERIAEMLCKDLNSGRVTL